MEKPVAAAAAAAAVAAAAANSSKQARRERRYVADFFFIFSSRLRLSHIPANMSTEDVKSFLYSWLGKKRKGTPEYDVRPAGGKQRQRFLCQLSVPGYEYVACGNSTNKKDAQSNAARDFLKFLERRGEIGRGEMPAEAGFSGEDSGGSFGTRPDLGLHQRQRLAPAALGEAYRPVGSQHQQQGDFNRQFLEAAQRRRVEEAEEADVNAALHGNWTMENAKSKLNIWMQDNKVKADYHYSTMGPDHNRSFVAEMKVYVRQLGRDVAAREAGSNKQSASKSCALSLVRQLFHLGVIEAFSGTLKKNRDVEGLAPYPALLSDQLEVRLAEGLQKLNLAAVDVGKVALKEGESLSLLTEKSTFLSEAGGERNYSGNDQNSVRSCQNIWLHLIF